MTLRRATFIALLIGYLGLTTTLSLAQSSRPSSQPSSQPSTQPSSPNPGTNLQICFRNCVHNGQMMAAHILNKTPFGIALKKRLFEAFQKNEKAPVVLYFKAAIHLQKLTRVYIQFKQNNKPVPILLERQILQAIQNLARLCVQACNRHKRAA